MADGASNGSSNPWLVNELCDFSFFCCPECDFRTKIEGFFEHHAVIKHPLSIEFFSAEVLEDDHTPVTDIKLDNDHFEKVKSEIDESEYFGDETFDEDYFEVDGVPKAEHDDHKSGFAPEIIDDKVQVKSLVKKRKRKKIELLDENDDDNSYDCPTCNVAVIGLCNLGLHLKNEHNKDNNDWQCPSCDRSFPALSKLRRHVTSVHLKLKVKCPQCDARVCESSFNQHMRVAHEGDRIQKPFRCEQCDFSSHALQYLKAHVKVVHEKDKHKLQCDECDLKFLFNSQLRDHKEAVHEGIKRFMCDKCGKGFQSKHMLNEHTIRGVCGVKEPIKCDKCDDVFSRRSYYIMHHRAIHGGHPMPNLSANATQFMCDQCPNIYDSKASLQQHIYNIHSNYQPPNNPKKCKFCDRVFKNLNSFKEHVKVVHEKSTPFKCDHCGKSFGTKTRLRSHVKLVHRRVKCEECGQEICNDFMLQRHKAAAHGTKPTNVLFCPHCPLFYKKQTFLHAHLSKQHPECIVDN